MIIFNFLVIGILFICFVQNINALGCSNVDSNGNLYLDNKVTSIGTRAFNGCGALKTISYQSVSKLQSINTLAFANTGLTTITIPASVKSIGQGAFTSCNGFNVYIENGNTMSITITRSTITSTF